jgi:hypothetical protein
VLSLPVVFLEFSLNAASFRCSLCIGLLSCCLVAHRRRLAHRGTLSPLIFNPGCIMPLSPIFPTEAKSFLFVLPLAGFSGGADVRAAGLQRQRSFCLCFS